MSRIHRPPISLARVVGVWLQVRQMKSSDRKDKIAVVVGTITNDIRILNLPKLKVTVKPALAPCVCSSEMGVVSVYICRCVPCV